MKINIIKGDWKNGIIHNINFYIRNNKYIHRNKKYILFLKYKKINYKYFGIKLRSIE